MNYTYVIYANGLAKSSSKESSGEPLAAYKNLEEAKSAMNRVWDKESSPSDEKWSCCDLYHISGYEIIMIPSF